MRTPIMRGTLSRFGERALLARIAHRFRRQPGHIVLGPGDDAAILKVPSGSLLVTSQDDLVEGTHFERAWASPANVASKLLGAAASDLAAMGDVSALGAMVSAGFPADINISWCQEFLEGVARASHRLGIPVVGGNLARSDRLFFSASVFGAARLKGIVRRVGARIGDLVAGVGPLGEAAAGLSLARTGRVPHWARGLVRAFWEPRPHFPEAKALVGIATSLMDNSDGLVSSARTLCESSGVGMQIELSQAPATPALRQYCAIRKVDLKGHQLSGGEDYGLIFTVPPPSWSKLLRRLPRAYILGVVTGDGLKVEGAEAAEVFEHFSQKKR